MSNLPPKKRRYSPPDLPTLPVEFKPALSRSPDNQSPNEASTSSEAEKSDFDVEYPLLVESLKRKIPTERPKQLCVEQYSSLKNSATIPFSGNNDKCLELRNSSAAKLFRKDEHSISPKATSGEKSPEEMTAARNATNANISSVKNESETKEKLTPQNVNAVSNCVKKSPNHNKIPETNARSSLLYSLLTRPGASNATETTGGPNSAGGGQTILERSLDSPASLKTRSPSNENGSVPSSACPVCSLPQRGSENSDGENDATIMTSADVCGDCWKFFHCINIQKVSSLSCTCKGAERDSNSGPNCTKCKYYQCLRYGLLTKEILKNGANGKEKEKESRKRFLFPNSIEDLTPFAKISGSYLSSTISQREKMSSAPEAWPKTTLSANFPLNIVINNELMPFRLQSDKSHTENLDTFVQTHQTSRSNQVSARAPGAKISIPPPLIRSNDSCVLTTDRRLNSVAKCRGQTSPEQSVLNQTSPPSQLQMLLSKQNHSPNSNISRVQIPGLIHRNDQSVSPTRMMNHRSPQNQVQDVHRSPNFGHSSAWSVSRPPPPSLIPATSLNSYLSENRSQLNMNEDRTNYTFSPNKRMFFQAPSRNISQPRHTSFTPNVTISRPSIVMPNSRLDTNITRLEAGNSPTNCNTTSPTNDQRTAGSSQGQNFPPKTTINAPSIVINSAELFQNIASIGGNPNTNRPNLGQNENLARDAFDLIAEMDSKSTMDSKINQVLLSLLLNSCSVDKAMAVLVNILLEWAGGLKNLIPENKFISIFTQQWCPLVLLTQLQIHNPNTEQDIDTKIGLVRSRIPGRLDHLKRYNNLVRFLNDIHTRLKALNLSPQFYAAVKVLLLLSSQKGNDKNMLLVCQQLLEKFPSHQMGQVMQLIEDLEHSACNILQLHTIENSLFLHMFLLPANILRQFPLLNIQCSLPNMNEANS